jgi:hypothetical protein
MLKTDQILALAPDPASAKAGNQLAAPAKWGELGRSDQALWGECQGSGKLPYRTQIDLSEPAFKCSCPSRKFPCKHGLGLYLLLDAQPALFAAANAPQWVSDWLSSRKERRDKKDQTRVEHTPEELAASAAQARKREDKRAQGVARGLGDLRVWLDDLAREGLAAVRERGPAFWDTMAARLVDSQAGALGARLRRACGMCFQPANANWESQLANELSSIYMLCKAYERLEQLPQSLQCDLRALIGWSVPQEDVLSQPSLTDRWQVLAQRTGDEERLRVRATWLRGTRSTRWALLLQYAAGGQAFDKLLTVGTQFDAELCFYPSAAPLRALVKEQSAASAIATSVQDLASLDDTLDQFATALAAQPFLERYPVMLAGLTPDVTDHGRLITSDGRQLALHPAFRRSRHLLALSGGHPLTLVGEWDGCFLLPLSVWHGGRLYNIETDLRE